jgi:hypothetical protein
LDELLLNLKSEPTTAAGGGGGGGGGGAPTSTVVVLDRLIKDQYSNYVIQHVIQYGRPDEDRAVVRHNLVELGGGGGL